MDLTKYAVPLDKPEWRIEFEQKLAVIDATYSSIAEYEAANNALLREYFERNTDWHKECQEYGQRMLDVFRYDVEKDTLLHHYILPVRDRIWYGSLQEFREWAKLQRPEPSRMAQFRKLYSLISGYADLVYAALYGCRGDKLKVPK